MEGGWAGGVSVLPAVRMALADINSDSTVLPSTVLEMPTIDNTSARAIADAAEISTDLYDTACSPSRGAEALIAVHNFYKRKIRGSLDPPLVGLFGAGCSPVCQSMQVLANIWGYPTVSYACTSNALSDVSSYPLFLRTAPTDSVFPPAWIALCERFGWTRVAAISASNTLFTSTVDAFARLLTQSSLTLSARATLVDGSAASAAAAAELLKQRQVHVIFFLCYVDEARAFFRALHAAGLYGRGYVLVGLGWLEPGWWDGDAAVAEVARYHWTVDKTLCGVPRSAACVDFEARFKATFPAVEHITHTHWAYDAMWVYARGLDAAIRSGADVYRAASDGEADGVDAANASSLWQLLRNVSFDGTSGAVGFDSVGDRATADLELLNVQPAAGGLWRPVAVGTYSATRGLAFNGVPYRFAGNRSEPPMDRHATLALLMRLTEGGVALGTEWQAIACAAVLAARHVNAHNGAVVSALNEISAEFLVDVELFDTQSSADISLDRVQAHFANYALSDAPISSQAIIGPAKSVVAHAVAGGIALHGVPQVSYWATDTGLSRHSSFSRTSASARPTNAPRLSLPPSSLSRHLPPPSSSRLLPPPRLSSIHPRAPRALLPHARAFRHPTQSARMPNRRGCWRLRCTSTSIGAPLRCSTWTTRTPTIGSRSLRPRPPRTSRGWWYRASSVSRAATRRPWRWRSRALRPSRGSPSLWSSASPMTRCACGGSPSTTACSPARRGSSSTARRCSARASRARRPRSSTARSRGTSR